MAKQGVKLRWWHFVVIIIFIILAVNYGTKKSGFKETSFDTDEFGVVTVRIQELTYIEYILHTIKSAVQSITLTPSVPKPGQSVSVNLALTIPYCDTAVNFRGYTGIIRLQVTQNSAGIISKDVQAKCSGTTCSNIRCGTSTAVTTSFTAPSTPGVYEIRYIIYDNDGKQLTYEIGQTFTVQEVITTCPNVARWNSWQLVYSISNGVYQSREHIAVGPYPGCQETTDQWQYRTVCNSGYYIDGGTATTATGEHTCLAPCTPSWSCTGWGACASGTQTRTCTDVNSCGVACSVPATCGTSQACTMCATYYKYDTTAAGGNQNCIIEPSEWLKLRAAWVGGTETNALFVSHGNAYFRGGSYT